MSANRLPNFSRAGVFPFGLKSLGVLFSWHNCEPQVLLGLDLLIFVLNVLFFLAIGSAGLLLHRYLNILLFILFVLSALIRKTLLRCDAFESISVFIKIAFPYRDSVLDDNMFVFFHFFYNIIAIYVACMFLGLY